MILSMTHRGTCAFCRCRIRGIYVGNFRVNKKSLRMVDSVGLAALDPKCAECDTSTALKPVGERWALAPDSQRKVDEYRARKGWPA